MNSNYNFKFVRTLRNSLGLTLKELAKMTSLTYTTLENIETNKAMPSLKTLDALAGGLQISTGELVSLSENQIVQRRKAQYHEEEISDKKNPGIKLCRVANYKSTKMLRVSAETGNVVHVPKLHENCNELCYVLSGCIDLAISGEKYRLFQDDSILFDGVLDHTYHQIETGEYITIHISKDISEIKNLLKQSEERMTD